MNPAPNSKPPAWKRRHVDLRLELIDRDAGLTLKRTWANLGFFKRAQLAAGLGSSLLSSDEIGEQEIEQLKEGDMLESSFGEFAKQTPELYQSIIHERDLYMAAKLRQLSAHAESGMFWRWSAQAIWPVLRKRCRDTGTERPCDSRSPSLKLIPAKSSIPWFTLVLFAFLALGFAWGYQQGGFALAGMLLLQWALITGLGGLIGCIAAKGHWLSCIAAFIASPLTPLHPALSSGMVSAYVEAKMHKPTYQDLLDLRQDTTEISGWWKNRFARILVNFILTNMGTALAVWIAGAAFFIKLG